MTIKLIIQTTPSPEYVGEERYRVDVIIDGHLMMDLVYSTKMNRFIADPTPAKWRTYSDIQQNIDPRERVMRRVMHIPEPEPTVDYATPIKAFSKKFPDFVRECGPLFLDTPEKIDVYNIESSSRFVPSSKRDFSCLARVSDPVLKEWGRKLGT